MPFFLSNCSFACTIELQFPASRCKQHTKHEHNPQTNHSNSLIQNYKSVTKFKVMLRLCNRTSRHCIRSYLLRTLSSSSSLSSTRNTLNPVDLQNSQRTPPAPPPTILHRSNNLSSRFPFSFPRKPFIAVSATLISLIAASYALISLNDEIELEGKPRGVYEDLEHAVERSNESFKKIVNRMKHTGVAASVLWKSLTSVLSSANHEVRSGFELKVAALLADIAAANESRRAAIVSAGGGAVLDWLLETVVVGGDNCGTQAESARALAYLIADPHVCGAVLGRPNAVPNLLRFIFSAQPQRSKKTRRSSFNVSDSLKGRSMLVAAIMDVVTSNCDSADKVSFMPSLPGNAEMRDIAAAIQVVEEGGMHLDESHGSEDDDDGGKGMKGIGMKVLGGTTVLGLSRTNGVELNNSEVTNVDPVIYPKRASLLNKVSESSPAQASLSSAVVPGLWDDLYSQHVAVPFAAWALANWATASEANRSHIQELDRDGHAVMTALLAPERSVKWHGSLVARLLLEDDNLPLNDSISDWSSSLLSTVAEASKAEDISLAQVALAAFLVSIERSTVAQKVVKEKGLPLMRETAKRTAKHVPVQETLAKALELLCTRDTHLSLQESQKWSGVLLSWLFGKSSSDAIRSSAVKILSCILEYHGPSSLPISQGWLAFLLTDILAYRKSTSLKGSNQPRSDQIKTQIDQSNILSATQTANQLATAVVNLAGNQLGTATDKDDTFPLVDLLSLEPFAGSFKNLKKDNLQKINAAESAVATLKGIKSLTEICSEDLNSQNKVVDFGVLCLLRRLLMRDDYENLAAIEAYDASRDLEAEEHIAKVSGESAVAETNDPTSVRVPPTAHIRRHAARLLTILSVLPKVQHIIAADETWCKWLEECSNGKILGCNDLKTQSYARATLLNIFCTEENGTNSVNDHTPDSSKPNKHNCPRYADMIFLINPGVPHWKCPEKMDLNSDAKTQTNGLNSNMASLVNSEDSFDNGSLSTSTDGSERISTEPPLLDVVFVHGLRGGPFKTWRLADDKLSTKSGLVEKIDEEAGKHGTFWPGEWLSPDFPYARMFSIKYKTNLTQWSGASLPLQEVSSMLLEKLIDAGIGERPVVFVTHSLGGLVVKQMLHQAKTENKDNLVNNTVGVVFYSCPHAGSKLADMPWRMGLVFRPAPTIGELRKGSPRLAELNNFIRNLHKRGSLEVLSFCETKVTPIVEGYGGWAFRMEIVPLDSAFPGFGELVVLDSTDHVNSCKPFSRSDPSYKETLDLLYKLKSRLS